MDVDLWRMLLAAFGAYREFKLLHGWAYADILAQYAQYKATFSGEIVVLGHIENCCVLMP